jgi:hypothetical protein
MYINVISKGKTRLIRRSVLTILVVSCIVFLAITAYSEIRYLSTSRSLISAVEYFNRGSSWSASFKKLTSVFPSETNLEKNSDGKRKQIISNISACTYCSELHGPFHGDGYIVEVRVHASEEVVRRVPPAGAGETGFRKELRHAQTK